MSSRTHATLRYTTLRLGIFVGCLVVVAVLAYAGVVPEGIGASNPLWVFLLALVLSAPLSFVLLRKQRDAMSEQIALRVERAKSKLAANRGMEDDAADAEAAARAEARAEPAADADEAASEPASRS